MRRIGLVLAAGIVAGGFALPAAALDGPAHGIVGYATLADGASIVLNADRTDGAVTGSAWLLRDVPLQINLGCIEVTWHNMVYPIYPYLPYHALTASGVGLDGVTYYVTVFDTSVAGFGLTDRAVVTTEPGPAACGGADGAPVVQQGDFTILG